jgi:hypothetical protein
MALRNTRRSGQVTFTGCQTTDYEQEVLNTDLEESGIRITTNEMVLTVCVTSEQV